MKTAGITFAWCLSVMVGGLEAADPPTNGSLLILKNGQVFEGRITRLGDRYQVALTGGGEIRVAATQVEDVATTYVQAYQQKQSKSVPGNFQNRLALAEWCLRHKLYEQSAAELTAAMYLEPQDPRVLGLERRLKAATFSSRPGPAIAPDDTPHTDRDPVTSNPSSLEDGRVVQASATRPIVDSLDQLASEVRPKAIEEFTQSIQPFLLNRCAANGCHGASESGSFQLIRPPVGKTLVRKLTLRNLQATLTQVDRAEPAASAILTVPQRPHGKAKGAIYNSETEIAVRRLTSWVNQVAEPLTTPQPATIQSGDEKLMQHTELPGFRHAIAAEPGAQPRDDVEQATRSSGASTPRTPTPRNAKPDYVPKDPFDPEVFNRRYRTAKD